MSMLQLLQANALVGRKARPRGRALPYLLSLPALLVCVAIIVPFVAAAVYSLQRYRLNLPYLRGFIGIQNYVDFLTDPAFWNTLRISLVYTALTVVLVDVWVYTPFIMILLLAGLRSLPRQPFEAAALDGVPATFVFFRITLPMLAPYIITASLFRLLDSIQQFDIIYAMTQGGPGDRLMVFQVQAYLEFFQYTNVGRSAALLMILWVITNILSNIFIKN